MAESAKLTVGADSIELPTVTGTEQEVGIDISTLRGSTGRVTLDIGFANTAACQSAITFLNGEQGVLRYRGYAIEDLADNAGFLEVTWALLNGELPTRDQLAEFERDVMAASALPEGALDLIRALPADSHPMGKLATLVSSLASYHEDVTGRTDDAVDAATLRLIGQLPTLAAAAYRISRGEEPVAPDPSLGYCANFLRMTFGDEAAADADLVRTLDLLFILHADHEQNCSTSSVRFVGSSHANLFASVAAGICALWGPLHGGANQKVLEMLEAIQSDGGDVEKYVALAKDKTSGFRLMGFGHRVYKNFDPRALLLKKQAVVVLEKLGIDDPLLAIAKRLAEHALEDEYFVERKLYPNVDFYSGIIYRALGFPTDMFTVLFSIGRLPGWIAHWQEHRDQGLRIGRPRQIYVGENARPFVPLDARG